MHARSATRALDADLRTWSGGRRCFRQHCQEWSIRTPDLLSYALDHHVWTCGAGHQIADDDPRTAMSSEHCREIVRSPREALERSRRSPTDQEIASAGRSIAQDVGLDLIEFLHVLVETCTALMDADIGTVLLTTSIGRLRSASSSIEDPRLADLFRISATEGPGFRCFTSGRSIDVPDLWDASASSMALRAAARRSGIRSTHATPLTVQDTTVGSLNLFFTRSGGLDADASRALRTLADDAMAATAAARLTRAAQDHLQEALDTRVLIERAKGVLMAVHDISHTDAQARITEYAGQHRIPAAEVARAILARTLDLPLNAHWLALGSPRQTLTLPSVLTAASPPGETAMPPRMAQEILRLIEHAAEVQFAAGKKAIARRHRIAAASLRRMTTETLPEDAGRAGDKQSSGAAQASPAGG